MVNSSSDCRETYNHMAGTFSLPFQVPPDLADRYEAFFLQNNILVRLLWVW